jgi:hypothetical protein
VTGVSPLSRAPEYRLETSRPRAKSESLRDADCRQYHPFSSGLALPPLRVQASNH